MKRAYHCDKETPRKNKAEEEEVAEFHELRRDKKVISLSRREDVLTDERIRAIEGYIREGKVLVTNPRNPNQTSYVSLSPKDVKIMAWWSKDYRNFIRIWESDSDVAEILKEYPCHIFNFTLNSPCKELETNLRTSYEDRLMQLQWLVEKFGADHVVLRIDPVCHYIYGGYHAIDLTRKVLVNHEQVSDNMGEFEQTVAFAASIGITAVTMAFMRPDARIVKRMTFRGLKVVVLDASERTQYMEGLVRIAAVFGVRILACADQDYLGCRPQDVPEEFAISKAQCIKPPEDIEDSVLPAEYRRKDGGQRDTCNCTKSTDIGSYKVPCTNGCQFCYGNPQLL